MTAQTPPYALHDPGTGTWYFRLPRREHGPHWGGHEPQSVRVAGIDARVVKSWVAVTPEPDQFVDADSEVVATYSGGSELVEWRLREPFRGSAMPETRTLDEMRELDEGSVEASAYKAVYEPRPDVEVRESGPRVLLDGRPRPEHLGRWVADLPYELREHAEFLHLFPGRLTDLWRVAEARLEEIPGVGAFVDSTGFGRKLKVGVAVALPAELRRPASGRRGTRKYRLAVSDRKIWREVTTELSDVVQASSLTEAVRVHQEQLAALVGWAEAAVKGTLCARCDGTGVVPAAEQRPTAAQMSEAATVQRSLFEESVRGMLHERGVLDMDEVVADVMDDPHFKQLLIETYKSGRADTR